MEWESTTWDGTLTIGAVSMHCPAWVVYDVHQLWAGPDERGEDVLIPGAAGRLAMPRRADKTVFMLPMEIDGSVSRSDVPYADFRDGYRRNLLWLRQNVTDPVSSGNGTRSVSLTTPAAGPTLTGAAHVSLHTGDQELGVWRAVLTLSFPAGGLA
jgi:hypothetical protein